MEKIIYNTKLKKIVSTILIFLLLLNLTVPIAYADLFMSFDPKQYIYDQGEIPPDADKDYDWSLEEWILTEDELITLKLSYALQKQPNDTPGAAEFNASIDQFLVAYEAGVAEYNEKLAEAKAEGMSLEDALNYATEKAAEKGDEILEGAGNTVIDEDGDEDLAANLGGILLSPVFFLINFIADSIISNLGNIMNGRGLSVKDGIAVLSDNVPQNGYSASTTYTVTRESLLSNPSAEGDIPELQYPNLDYTPETIFMGGSELFRIDFVTGSASTGDAAKLGWGSIRNVVAQWYNVLRMAAVVGLLAVLIYTGIKIIISANAKDKAKYKEWIGNWFMAVAILFSMHIIMAFIVSVTGQLSNLIGGACQGIKVECEGMSFTTNLMGLVRFMIQSENFYIKIGYEVMYIALIVYTIKFTIVYLKRMLNMAFLTLIAPLVALMYPIDKINDGRSQAFDMWLKEYIFNALLQPVHQIMYYILVGSAVSIAATNPIYGIVVLAFMTEAEKLLKKIFGFDKASGGTVGGMAGAFAAGALASNIKNIAKLGGGKGNGGKDADGSEASIYDNPKVVNAKEDADKDNALFPGTGGDSDNSDSSDEQESPASSNLKSSSMSGDLNENDVAAWANYQRQQAASQNPPADNSSDDSDGDGGNSRQSTSSAQQQDSSRVITKPIRKVDRTPFSKGMRAVGKKILKPVWDLDHKGTSGFGIRYNGKRLIRKIGRGALGVGMGIGAAAVQAGISITDGKYNPLEGIATFAAGYAGAGQIAKGYENMEKVYQEGRDAEDKDAIMRGARERWPDRDDVIKYNKKYKAEERENIIEIQKELLSQGMTDPKEMDKCIKDMKERKGGKLEGITKDDVRRSRVAHDFSSELNSYGINPHKPDDVQKYKDTVTKGLSGAAKTQKEQQIDSMVKSVIDYRTANKPK